jgi:hypothetical protein
MMCLVYVTKQTSFSTGLIPLCCDIKLEESSLFLNSFTQNNGQTADTRQQQLENFIIYTPALLKLHK